VIELASFSRGAFTAFAALLGLVLGSFLNVVIYRIPRILEREWRRQCAELESGAGGRPAPGSDEPRFNLFVPGSACPACGHRIGPLENIPLLSYLVLRGRCRACGAPIGIRYPLVEALTGLVYAAVAWRFEFGYPALAAMGLSAALIALTFIDLEAQLLPDVITLSLLWAGLVVNLRGIFCDLNSAVAGAVLGYLALWSIHWAYRLAAKREGIGYGDFKLLAAIGAWLGAQMLPVVILVSSVAGATFGLALMAFAGRSRTARVPFGPFLALGGLIALMWGRTLIDAWMRGFA
jgi:leader peptidase (prepilin peptidase) / N-methyltransferase